MSMCHLKSVSSGGLFFLFRATALARRPGGRPLSTPLVTAWVSANTAAIFVTLSPGRDDVPSARSRHGIRAPLAGDILRDF